MKNLTKKDILELKNNIRRHKVAITKLKRKRKEIKNYLSILEYDLSENRSYLNWYESSLEREKGSTND